MTIDQALAFLKGLDEGATKGDWLIDGGDVISRSPSREKYNAQITILSGENDQYGAQWSRDGDVALIAHVRNVLPQLIGVVEAAPDVLAASIGNDYSCTVPTATLKTLHDALTALAAAVEKESK